MQTEATKGIKRKGSILSQRSVNELNVQRWCQRTAEWLVACRQQTVDDAVLLSSVVEPVWSCCCRYLPSLYSQQLHQRPSHSQRRQLCSSCSWSPAAGTQCPSLPCRCWRRQFVGRTAELNTRQPTVCREHECRLYVPLDTSLRHYYSYVQGRRPQLKSLTVCATWPMFVWLSGKIEQKYKDSVVVPGQMSWRKGSRLIILTVRMVTVTGNRQVFVDHHEWNLTFITTTVSFLQQQLCYLTTRNTVI